VWSVELKGIFVSKRIRIFAIFAVAAQSGIPENLRRSTIERSRVILPEIVAEFVMK